MSGMIAAGVEETRMHVAGVLQEHACGHDVGLPTCPWVRGLGEGLAQGVDVVARRRQAVDVGLFQRRDQRRAPFHGGRRGPDRLKILRAVEGGEAFVGRRRLRDRLAQGGKCLRLRGVGQERRHGDRSDGKGQCQKRCARKSQTHGVTFLLRGEFFVYVPQPSRERSPLFDS
jgi:hypothetical protein